MRGRTPKPTQMKKLAGTLRKHRQNHDEPQHQAGTPEPPAELDARALETWNYYAPILSGCRVLTMADRETLGCYCWAVSRHDQAEANIAKFGPVIKTPAGFAAVNPWLSVANKAIEQILRFGAELGLSPASRSRVKAAPAATVETGRKRFFKTVG